MANVYADRVRDTTTTTGTGPFTVAAAPPSGYRTFSVVCSTNDTFSGCIEDPATGDWVTGKFTYSGSNQITVTTVKASSNSNSAVSFGSGSKNVFMTPIAYGFQGIQEIWIPASAMVANTTNGAAVGSVEVSTNKNMLNTLDFDASTQEFAQFSIRMPNSWNEGTVTFLPLWSHPSTTTNFGVVWQMRAVAISNGDALDAAFGTAQTSTDTGGTTDTSYEGPESSAITIAGSPAAGDYVNFQVARVPSNGSDTLAVDARLAGIVLRITVDDTVDA
jgi:hypothetical protein